MKISNILVSAAIVISSLGAFSASVTKKNYDDLNGNDDVVVDIDFSGISGGPDTNAVNDLIGEYDRTNLTGRIDGKVDLGSIDGAARPLPPYLHYIHFDDSYPDDAEWYYDKIDHIGYCSCRRIGSLFERNYDWTFDESATFVGTMSRGVNHDGTTRYASVFVSSAGTNLSEQVVKSGKWSRCYKALPGMCLDGINENGLFANINVVVTNGAPWETKGDRDLNMLGCIRYVLDHFMRAEDAAKYVAERAYIPNSMKRLGASFHIVVGDENETWLVEDGIAYIRPDGVPSIMTNFRLAVSDDPYGTGYERFEILSDESNSITNAWYTNAYKPVDGIFPWPTEFAAPGLATHTQTNFLQQWAQQVIIPELPPKRNGKWWQTVHCTTYDITNRTMRIAVQEKDDWYVFKIPGDNGYVKSVNGKTGNVGLSAQDLGAIPSICDDRYEIGGKFRDDDGEANYWARVWDGKRDGHYSAMFGYGNEASEKMALAIGLWAKAVGEYSISLGVGSEANGYASLAVGEEAKANVGWSTAIGFKAYTDSDATCGTALGYYSHSKDIHATAIGSISETHGQFTVSIGHSTNNVNRYAFLDPFEPKDLFIGDISLQKHLDSTRDAAVDKVIAMKKRYAMFIIPMNDTSYSSGDSHFTQFELKASTNNFSSSASQHDRCCFYSHSGHADGFFSTNDKMHLFLNHGGADQRSYVRIQNTLEGMPDYAPAEVIVIVDAEMMNPDRSDGSWLYDGNEDVVWTWVRTKDGEREFDADTDHCLWRPIAPVRWFSRLPAWAE